MALWCLLKTLLSLPLPVLTTFLNRVVYVVYVVNNAPLQSFWESLVLALVGLCSAVRTTYFNMPTNVLLHPGEEILSHPASLPF